MSLDNWIVRCDPIQNTNKTAQITIMKTRLSLLAAIGTCIMMASCDKQSSEKTTNSDTRNSQNSTQPATPAVRIKTDLSFEATVSLKTPPDAVSKVAAGRWDSSASEFDPPVHPIGSFQNLRLNGKDIPLANNDLKEGILTTIGFGEIEVLLTGTNNGRAVLEYRALPADIEKLKKAYPDLKK